MGSQNWRNKLDAINAGKYTSIPKGIFNCNRYYDKLNDREVLIFKASKLSKSLRRYVLYYSKFDVDLRYSITDINLRRKRSDDQLRVAIPKVEKYLNSAFVSPKPIISP